MLRLVTRDCKRWLTRMEIVTLRFLGYDSVIDAHLAEETDDHDLGHGNVHFCEQVRNGGATLVFRAEDFDLFLQLRSDCFFFVWDGGGGGNKNTTDA